MALSNLSSKFKRKSPDFKILASSKAIFGRFLIVKAFKTDVKSKENFFLGVIASKKVSNKANIRNHVRRRLKAIGYELSRQNTSTFNNFHWLFIAKKNIVSADYHDLLIDCSKITKNYVKFYNNN